MKTICSCGRIARGDNDQCYMCIRRGEMSTFDHQNLITERKELEKRLFKNHLKDGELDD